jgi:hypothetical protein
MKDCMAQQQDFTGIWRRAHREFVCAPSVEQAAGALAKKIVYPHLHRLDPITYQFRSL